MSVMTESVKKGDHLVLYVSQFSEIGANSEHVGDFLECHVLGLMKDMTGDQDDNRLFIRCSRDLRGPSGLKLNMNIDEALISVDSPFIMTWDEYKGCKYDPDYLDNWLQTIKDTELLNIDDIVSGMSKAFHSEHREAIRFPE